MTWLIGWQYRKSHIISPQAGAETFYQKQITVHYGAGVDGDDDVYCTVGGVAHCKTDFGDIRFTDNDGETELDYWIESKVDSDYAIIWVEVADDLSTEAKTIYVYYGKADATYPFGADQTEMDATFLFADHFYGSSLNLAKWAGDTGYASVSGSKLTYIGDASWRKIYTTTLGTQFVLRQKTRFQGRTTNYGAIIGLRHVTTTDWVQIMYFYDAAVSDIRCAKAGTATSLDSNADTIERIYDVLWRSAQADFVKDGTAMTNSPITTNVPIVTLPIRFEAISGAGYGVECDWVFARKYVSPEPTHGSWGSEEQQGIAHYKTITELLGGLDSKARTKECYRIKSELLGLLDTRSKVKEIYRSVSELLGALDIKSRVKSYYRTVTELMGALDTKSRIKSCFRTITELLGELDTRSRIKSVFRTVTEKLGELDSYITTHIAKIVGGLKRLPLMLDKFLGWMRQPETDNPRIRGSVKTSFEETKRIFANLKMAFQETIQIKSKVAEIFEETMPIIASIINDFQETIQTKGSIIKKFEETVGVSADIMRAVFQETMAKVKGIVVPIREKLKELRRRIEEITADDKEELKRRIEEMEEEE